jgi:DNA polymerase III subunit chi
MTRVDFYVLRSADIRNRQLLACRLTEKAYRLDHTVYVHTDSPTQSRAMDDLLWTFRAGSFVPHVISGKEQGSRLPPVFVGHESEPQCNHDVLINLSPDIPAAVDRFDRIIEVIDQDEIVRQAGRRRYRFYQEKDYPLATHKLDGSRAHTGIS